MFIQCKERSSDKRTWERIPQKQESKTGKTNNDRYESKVVVVEGIWRQKKQHKATLCISPDPLHLCVDISVY